MHCVYYVIKHVCKVQSNFVFVINIIYIEYIAERLTSSSCCEVYTRALMANRNVTKAVHILLTQILFTYYITTFDELVKKKNHICKSLLQLFIISTFIFSN